jgi:hypothetical protein
MSSYSSTKEDLKTLLPGNTWKMTACCTLHFQFKTLNYPVDFMWRK